MGVLSSLWEALEVEQEDVDRGIFARLMSGPARLHGKSIQKVRVSPDVAATSSTISCKCRVHDSEKAAASMSATPAAS